MPINNDSDPRSSPLLMVVKTARTGSVISCVTDPASNTDLKPDPKAMKLTTAFYTDRVLVPPFENMLCSWRCVKFILHFFDRCEKWDKNIRE
jgi:hypothetical protein